MTEKYWKKRSAKRMFSYIDKADEVADVVGKAYLNAAKYLQVEAEKVFEAYRRNIGLSEHEAKQLLSKVGNELDYESFKRVYNKVKDPEIRKTLLAQLDAPAYRARLQRLEGLRKKVLEQCNEIYGVELKEANKHLFELANDAYNLSMYDIQKGIGYGFEFAQLSKEGIEEILKNEWSGEHYSKRIWANTKKVAELVKDEIFLGEMVGKSAHDMSAAIMDKMGVGAMQARRLIRTESCFVANQAEMESYKECDLERYRFIATLDLVTSDVCAALDGKTFPVDQQQPGVNCPPMHPNCRSTTIACIDDDDLEGLKRRARNPVTGENMTVPADFTYEAWEKKYVSDSSTYQYAKISFANRHTDKLQFEKYKGIYGEELKAKTLAEFQSIKYNDSDGWAYLKANKQNRLNQKSFEELGNLKGRLGNKEVRSWYKAHDENIPNIINRDVPLIEQAKQAHSFRNTYRTQARELMKDQKARKELDRTSPNKSFEELVEHKKLKYGLSEQEAYEDIIRSSATTNKKYDEAAGLKGSDDK